MERTERIKRPKLERTQPIRSWSALFAASGDGAEGSSAAEPAPAPRGGPLNDVVSRSVDLGYRVIDEYIRQGQHAARRLSERSYGPSAISSDVQEIATRVAQFASDFSALALDLMQMTAGSAARWSEPPANGSGPVAAAPPMSAPSASSPVDHGMDLTRVRVAVSSPHSTEVSLDLRPQITARHLIVQSLRSVDPDQPRLSDVSVEAASGEEPVIVRIRVPADQPAGVYNGLIIDEETSRPVGTVSLRVLPA